MGHAWADNHLPKTAPLKEGERRRHKTLVLDYEGPPKVKLALELLWHWCEYLVGTEEGRKLFTKLCEALNAHFKLHF